MVILNTKFSRTIVSLGKIGGHSDGKLKTSKLNNEVGNKLVMRYIWSISMYGSEKWTLRKLEWIYLDSWEM
jgi:hypothetical protein